MTQAQALDILKMGRNAFVTGPAGSGKTHVINQYVKYLKDHGISVGVTASTGIAATHLGGITIHSWAGMGIKSSMDDRDLADLSEKERVIRRMKESSVLIIDEISMLDHFRLDMLDTIARYVRGEAKPFGGLQVVLCGDFFQLPPVSKFGEPDTHFVYRSEAWRDGNFTICYLEKSHRHGDDPINHILGEIRSGEVSDGAMESLNERSRTARRFEDGMLELPDREEGNDVGGEHDSPTRLFTHNVDVDKVNEMELDKVDGVEITYEMETRGKKMLVETLKRSCLAPEKLRLKKGARVMCVKNNFDKGYVNGTLGVVVSCGFGVDPVIRTAGTPDFPDGKLVTIEPADWTIEDGGKVLAQLTQYPLRLAWAITVHKSQGMSLDAVEVDLSKAFEPGMGYVALSRVRTLSGLRIAGMNDGALRVHPDVLDYDRRLKDSSRQAESIMEYADVKEITMEQEAFLARVAPMHALGKHAKGRSNRRSRSRRSRSALSATARAA